jgi:hypothetical protein
MININSIFMKPKIVEIYEISWIPFLFGLNTIYSIFEYLRTLNNNRLVKIKNLEELLNNTNNKCNELQNKYDILYDNFQQLNTKINNLDVKIFELNDTKIDELNIETNNIYRGLCDLSHITSEIHTTENEHNSEDINTEFIDSLSLDYDHNENGDSEQTFSDEFNIVRTRSTSLTEFNWTTLAKKFFLG